jgi:hypothetical protein
MPMPPRLVYMHLECFYYNSISRNLAIHINGRGLARLLIAGIRVIIRSIGFRHNENGGFFFWRQKS